MDLCIMHGEVRKIGPYSSSPFECDSMDDSYRNLLAEFGNAGMRVCIVSPFEYDGNAVSNAWIFGGERWNIVKHASVNAAYIRFTGYRNRELARRKAALLMHDVKIVNDIVLDDICTDKLRTSMELGKYSQPSFLLNGQKSRDFIRKHEDLFVSGAVVKPRFGSRGEGVVKLDDLEEVLRMQEENYIVQPFLETGSGIPELGVNSRHDVRVIMVNKTPSYVEIRSYSGTDGIVGVENRIVLSPDRLPREFFDAAMSIDSTVSAQAQNVYSIDMARDSGGNIIAYELNSRPQICWSECDSQERIDAKKILHKKIALSLASH